MKIVEKFLLSKYGENAVSEDLIFESEDIVAVIDGATSKSQKLWGGVSSGFFAAKTICVALNEIKRNLNAIDTINYLNDYLITQIGDKKIPFNDRPMASLVLYNNTTSQIIRYGDCKFLIDAEEFPRVNQNDIALASKRAKILLEAIEKGKSIEELKQKDIGREFILDQLARNTEYANHAGKKGYPAINGTIINKNFIDCYSVKKNSQIILASDGYPFLKPTLEESEAELKRVIEEEPLLIKQYISTKGMRQNQVSFDDRAYVRLKI